MCSHADPVTVEVRLFLSHSRPMQVLNFMRAGVVWINNPGLIETSLSASNLCCDDERYHCWDLCSEALFFFPVNKALHLCTTQDLDDWDSDWLLFFFSSCIKKKGFWAAWITQRLKKVCSYLSCKKQVLCCQITYFVWKHPDVCDQRIVCWYIQYLHLQTCQIC